MASMVDLASRANHANHPADAPKIRSRQYSCRHYTRHAALPQASYNLIIHLRKNSTIYTAQLLVLRCAIRHFCYFVREQNN